MTREGGSRKKPSGTRKGAPNESRESQRNRSGAAAEDNEGGSSRKISKSEFEILVSKDQYLLPGFAVSKNEQTLNCAYSFYEAYFIALRNNMGDSLKSLLDTVTQIVENVDKITDADHELHLVFGLR